MKLRLTYSGVVSTLALFIAVSTGGAYAKATLIDGRTIKPNTVTATQIKNGTLTKADLAPATVKQLKDQVLNSTPDGYTFGTSNPLVKGGVFVSDVVATGVGQPCVILKGPNQTKGIWEQSLGGPLFTCDPGDGSYNGAAGKGMLNGAVNAF